MTYYLHWIVDEDLISEHHPDIPNYIRNTLGHKFTGLTATRDFPSFKKFDVSAEECINVFHGSYEELRRVKAAFHDGHPHPLREEPRLCTYGLDSRILRSHYTSYLPKKWFFNADATMTTWGHFCLNHIDYFSRNDEIFIRPDSGYKTFTGQVVDYSHFEEQKKVLEQFSSVLPETIIWVSPSQYVINEYRVWISNGKIVTATEYSWNDTEISGHIPDCVYDLAKTVAEYPWQVDRIYVCDIHLDKKGVPSVIEFNSFSCSGLYQCDAKLLFKTVSEDIISEWNED